MQMVGMQTGKINPQSYDIRRGIVTSKSVLRQPLASSGGVAISVREATKEEVKRIEEIMKLVRT